MVQLTLRACDPRSRLLFLDLTPYVTNQKEIYVDWLPSGRRLSYNDEEVSQQHDILSVRSWMMVKDLKYCDTCSTAASTKSSKNRT